ncbi:MAG: hypothetical protein C0591_03095 [Marinilabiliales bacterium]|nr:MAG: hypothetical protein C0591_03095 [Marinilabiliales bacterium]
MLYGSVFLVLTGLMFSCKQTSQDGKNEFPKQKFKMTTDIPASITTPDVVETSLGTLRFFDGFPDEATVETVYDNLDFQRGVQAFLRSLPAAALYGLRRGIRTYGPDNQTVIFTESFSDSRQLAFVPNCETVYTCAWLDTKGGPLVIELPPNVLGFINDFWGRNVVDLGMAGPDVGRGGRYLLLPPEYTDASTEGYFVAHSSTYGNFIFFRGFALGGDPKKAVEDSKTYFRVYPLVDLSNPPEMNFVNIAGKYWNTIPAADTSYFEQIAQVVTEEPINAIDPETRGLLGTIGIQIDQPFDPDKRMKKILADAVSVGNATARALRFSTRNQDVYYYPNSAWKMLFVGGDPGFSPDGVLDPDSRAAFFYCGWGITPAMATMMVGKGSQYAIAEHDASGNYLNGERTYSLHLPPNIPAKDFWSVIIYDPQTRSMLQTDQQYPSINSQKDDLVVNPDGSVDIHFGPKPPSDNNVNCLQTIPGKGWFVWVRLYGPLEPWFDKTWRPGEIKLVK